MTTNKIDIRTALDPERSLTSDSVYLVLVSGGTASGKTTAARYIAESLHGKSVAFISQDNFYAEHHDPAVRAQIAAHAYNFDHPSAIDSGLLYETLIALKQRRAVDIPVYDFATSSRTSSCIHVEPADVIIVEGIFALYFDKIRELANLKIFVHADADVRLARRITRDTRERGRSLESILGQYLTFVRESYEMFIEPCKRFADIILPNIENSGTGMQLNGLQILVRHLNAELNIRSACPSPRNSQSGSPPADD